MKNNSAVKCYERTKEPEIFLVGLGAEAFNLQYNFFF
jgi:hypothetical protein